MGNALLDSLALHQQSCLSAMRMYKDQKTNIVRSIADKTPDPVYAPREILNPLLLANDKLKRL